MVKVVEGISSQYLVFFIVHENVNIFYLMLFGSI